MKIRKSFGKLYAAGAMAVIALASLQPFSSAQAGLIECPASTPTSNDACPRTDAPMFVKARCYCAALINGEGFGNSPAFCWQDNLKHERPIITHKASLAAAYDRIIPQRSDEEQRAIWVENARDAAKIESESALSGACDKYCGEALKCTNFYFRRAGEVRITVNEPVCKPK